MGKMSLEDKTTPKPKAVGCLLGIVGAIGLPIVANVTQNEVPIFRSILENGPVGYGFLIGAGFGMGYLISYYAGCFFGGMRGKNYHDDIFDK